MDTLSVNCGSSPTQQRAQFVDRMPQFSAGQRAAEIGDADALNAAIGLDFEGDDRAAGRSGLAAAPASGSVAGNRTSAERILDIFIAERRLNGDSSGSRRSASRNRAGHSRSPCRRAMLAPSNRTAWRSQVAAGGTTILAPDAAAAWIFSCAAAARSK